LVFASSYIDLWRPLHRAEEILLRLEPTNILINQARFDLLRYSNSAVNSEGNNHTALLNEAIQLLSDPNPANKAQIGDDSKPKEASPSTLRSSEDAVAAIQATRHAMNVYRDSRRTVMVLARDMVMATAAGAGIILYGSAWLAIMAVNTPADNVPMQAILGAAACFTAGALVGLVSRLRGIEGVDALVDDYGLSVSRLYSASVLSGITGLLGVLLTGVISLTHSASINDEMTIAKLGGMPGVFNLTQTPYDLIIAGVFGLTPSLLLSQLREQFTGIKKELASTEAAGHIAPKQ